jgi:hypothetical protein
VVLLLLLRHLKFLDEARLNSIICIWSFGSDFPGVILWQGRQEPGMLWHSIIIWIARSDSVSISKSFILRPSAGVRQIIMRWFMIFMILSPHTELELSTILRLKSEYWDWFCCFRSHAGAISNWFSIFEIRSSKSIPISYNQYFRGSKIHCITTCSSGNTNSFVSSASLGVSFIPDGCSCGSRSRIIALPS